MENTTQGFHVFGTEKVLVHCLALYGLKLPSGGSEKLQVEIKRTYRNTDGSYRHESSNVKCQIFDGVPTLYLHDIFLTDSFGLTLTFKDSTAALEFPTSAAPLKSPLEFRTLELERIQPTCHIELGSLK